MDIEKELYQKLNKDNHNKFIWLCEDCKSHGAFNIFKECLSNAEHHINFNNEILSCCEDSVIYINCAAAFMELYDARK